MFKKIVCSMLSLCVFAMTMPTPAYAAEPIGEFVELLDAPGDFRPLLEYTEYVAPAPRKDEMAYFASVDEFGRLWSVDVNLTKAKATFAADDGTALNDKPLSTEHVEAFRTAANLASEPGDRLQCGTICGVVIGGIIAIGISIYFREEQCMITAAHQAWAAGQNAENCQNQMINGQLQGKECSMSYSRQDVNLDACFGGSVTCSVHCS